MKITMGALRMMLCESADHFSIFLQGLLGTKPNTRKRKEMIGYLIFRAIEAPPELVDPSYERLFDEMCDICNIDRHDLDEANKAARDAFLKNGKHNSRLISKVTRVRDAIIADFADRDFDELTQRLLSNHNSLGVDWRPAETSFEDYYAL
jgi:hypothetical protein